MYIKGKNNPVPFASIMKIPTNFVEAIHTAQPPLWSESFDLARGQFLVAEGQIEQHIYFVISGALRVFYVAENQEHTIRLGYSNNIINDLPSFLSGLPGQLYIEAIKKTVLKKANRTQLYALRDSKAAYTLLWIKMLETLFLQQFEREVDLLTTAPEARYQRVLQRSPQLFQEIPHKYIAAYLRMSPETLSRIQKS